MARHDDGQPAFPVKGGMVFYLPKEFAGQIDEIAKSIQDSYNGMSLRDYFAGQALAGIGIKLADISDDVTRSRIMRIAGTAYELADAMLAARNAEKAS
jgi:hypothetical protein